MEQTLFSWLIKAITERPFVVPALPVSSLQAARISWKESTRLSLGSQGLHCQVHMEPPEVERVYQLLGQQPAGLHQDEGPFTKRSFLSVFVL